MGKLGYPPFFSCPFQMFLHRFSPGLIGIGFTQRIVCCGITVDSPVIQHLCHMSCFPGKFRTAQNKIIILGSVKILPESSCLLYHRILYTQKMSDIIVRTQQIRTEFRFKMGILMFQPLSCFFHLIFIRVNNLHFRILIDQCDNLIKCFRSQQVVMIQKSNPGTCGHRQPLVGVSCNSKIFLQTMTVNPCFPVFTAVSAHCLCHCFGRRGVHQTEFPVFIRLLPDRIQHFQQIFFRRLITGNHYAEQRAAGKFSALPPLAFQFFLTGPVFLEPWLIRHFLRLHFVTQPVPESLWSIMSEIPDSFFYFIGCDFHSNPPTWQPVVRRAS